MDGVRFNGLDFGLASLVSLNDSRRPNRTIVLISPRLGIWRAAKKDSLVGIEKRQSLQTDGARTGQVKKGGRSSGAPPKIFVEMNLVERNCTRREPVAKLAKPGPPVSDLGGGGGLFSR